MSGDFKGIIGWQKTSFINFPGTVSTVLFFEGCNLRCPYCHNPDIVFSNLPQIPWSLIESYLCRREGVIEGVVLSGGEPTLHVALPVLVKQLRENGFLIKIDTNGSNPEMILECKPDYLALDIKTDPKKYAELGCKSKEFEQKLLDTLDIVKSMGTNAEVRITAAYPYINENVVASIAVLLSGVEKVFLQPLKLKGAVLDPSFGVQNVIELEQIRKLRDLIAPYVGNCVIRGE